MCLAAFLSFFSEMMTCDFWKSRRFETSTPGTCLMCFLFVFDFLTPRPPHEPCEERKMMPSRGCQQTRGWLEGAPLKGTYPTGQTCIDVLRLVAVLLLALLLGKVLR
jgi:hypothetical protein